MIYSLIGDAMRKMNAVSKDSINQTQGFKYRGIDAVMNALYPVMSELGLFIVPEVLEHRANFLRLPPGKHQGLTQVQDNDQHQRLGDKPGSLALPMMGDDP